MVQIYRRKWTRGVIGSLLGYLRDLVVQLIPMRRLPLVLMKLLYGCAHYRFAFFVHPRTYQDIFIASPFLNPLKFILRKMMGYKFFSHCHPFVLNRVTARNGFHGVVIAKSIVPELITSRRKYALRSLEGMLKFASKICVDNATVGLGGWYPMVTSRGSALKEPASKLNLIVTNGHCGTLASIYLTVIKILQIVNIQLSQACLGLIGVGKMGMNIARVFNGKVKMLVLLDINGATLKKAESDLGKSAKNKTVIVTVKVAENNMSAVKEALQETHIGICATSNLRSLLRLKDLPVGYVVIDDSRPEAIPRDPKLGKLILEGGLLNVDGINIDYDYGFGAGSDVFGCLGEAYVLALDGLQQLAPTLGEVDMTNFYKFISFCSVNNVNEGNLKSSEYLVTRDVIEDAFKKRTNLKNAVIRNTKEHDATI
jgi:predicted amino acid dehydrogenase